MKRKNFGIIAGLMIVVMATVNVNLSQNNNSSDVSLSNVEALTNESDWVEGYVTGTFTVGKITIPCCVSSVSTNSCDYGVIGCASATNTDN
jgi:hypothetical protein